MKIALNASLLYDAHLRGWNRYTVSLIEGLKELNCSLYLYSRKPVHEKFKRLFGDRGISYRDAPSQNYFLWESFTLANWCREDQVDIFHSPFNYGLPMKDPHCPKVLTLHDAIEKKFYDKNKSHSLETLKFNFIQSRAPKRADHIITVSYHAKSDIQEIFNIPNEKISVTYEAHPKVFEKQLDQTERDKVLQKYKIANPFFFYVGGFDERKNLDFALQAFSLCQAKDHVLVLAGGGDYSDLKRKASALGISSSVQFPGYIEDEDLPALYQSASAFIYPSLYEGFGLQACEAMASGCPTLVANRTSLPEVVEEGGLSFDLDDPSQLAGTLTNISQNPDLRSELSKKAKTRSKAFNWLKTATETLDIYKKLLGKI